MTTTIEPFHRTSCRASLTAGELLAVCTLACAPLFASGRAHAEDAAAQAPYTETVTVYEDI